MKFEKKEKKKTERKLHSFSQNLKKLKIENLKLLEM
jgi:hypothetical protein